MKLAPDGQILVGNNMGGIALEADGQTKVVGATASPLATVSQKGTGKALQADGDVVVHGGVIANSFSSTSDRAAKEHFAPVSGLWTLERLLGIPITTWNYRSQPDGVRHMGPTAQDFYGAFGLGESRTHISTLDADGVAFSAIQGLYRLVKAKEARIARLERQNARLEARIARLERLVAQALSQK